MPLYFNTTRGPLAVSFASGKSMSIPPKTWAEIDAEDEGSPNLAPMVRKGYLKRSALAVTEVPTVAEVAVESEAPALITEPSPTPAPEAAPEAVPAPPPTLLLE